MPSALAFHHDQSNDHNSSLFCSLLDDTEEINVSNLETVLFLNSRKYARIPTRCNNFRTIEQNADTTLMFQIVQSFHKRKGCFD